MPSMTPEALAAFLAKGGHVTKCAPGTANAVPVARLRAIAERNADNGHGYTAASPVVKPEAEWLWEMGFQQEAVNRARGVGEND